MTVCTISGGKYICIHAAYARSVFAKDCNGICTDGSLSGTLLRLLLVVCITRNFDIMVYDVLCRVICANVMEIAKILRSHQIVRGYTSKMYVILDERWSQSSTSTNGTH